MTWIFKPGKVENNKVKYLCIRGFGCFIENEIYLMVKEDDSGNVMVSGEFTCKDNINHTVFIDALKYFDKL